MNRSIQLLLTLFICANSLYAQDTKELEINIENLSKKWELVDIINPDKTKEELKEMLSFLESTSLHLNNDLTCIYSLVLDLKGTWTLNGNVISVTHKKGKAKWVIHSLQKKTIILSRNQAKQKLVFKSV